MAGVLHNRLVDACVVVGMDEQTGLLPLPNMSRGDQVNEIDVLGPFQLNVLSVLTGTTAFFPCQQEQLSGMSVIDFCEKSIFCLVNFILYCEVLLTHVLEFGAGQF